MQKQRNQLIQTNWAGNESWNPQTIVFPVDKKDLVGIVKKACIEKRKIKVIGSGHSFSRCASTSDIQINLENINSILSFNGKSVEVEAGILLKDLYQFFDDNHVALPSIPNTNNITLGGAISNAAHGTNLHHGTISSFVFEIKMITATGHILKIDRDSKYFDAVICSFGSLGGLEGTPKFRQLSNIPTAY